MNAVCRRRRGWCALLSWVGLALAALACSLGTMAPAKPTVVIVFPQPGATTAAGREIVVQSVSAVADARGIIRVELWADGQLVHTQTVNPPATSFTASQPWTPGVAGNHLLEVRAYNTENVCNDPALVTVGVVEMTAEPTPLGGGVALVPDGAETPVATSLAPATVSYPSSTPVMPTAEPAAVVTATSAARTSVDQVAGSAAAVALMSLNVRSGPGTEYPTIGAMGAGQSAQITGKNPDGSWWQIVYPLNSGERGWISAKAQYSRATNAAAVPVVIPPPPPPTAAPTPTATPTPVPERPTIFAFWADRTVISAGESVTLHWDLGNARAAYLHYDDTQEGVVAPGSKTVAPAITTVYSLVATNEVGDTSREVTITVNQPACSQPVVILDMIPIAPLASWTSALGANVLPWSGSQSDPRGFVTWADNIVLEDGSRLARVLATVPAWSGQGDIMGDFALPRPIQAGDRFKSGVGFIQGSGGDAQFIVAAAGGALPGTPVVAAIHDAAGDGEIRHIDADLSPVAGGTVIRLVVRSNAAGGQYWAVWVNPRVEH